MIDKLILSKYLKQLIAEYIDFPKKDIIFKDILPILEHPDIFKDLINNMSKGKVFKNTDAIISVDARGFIFGTAIAMKLSKPMIVARKPGKLPGELITKSYELEYGKNSLSIQKESLKRYKSFVIVDDLLATGGTIKCISDILKEASKKVSGISIVIELGGLNGRHSIPFPIESQIIL